MTLLDPYMDNNKCIERLYNQWKSHPKLIIACDFDSTLFDFYGEGHEFPAAMDMVRECQALGFYIVIFTASKQDRHDFITEYMLNNGVKIDAINKNPIELPYGQPGSKIFFNILLDDRAGLKSAMYILSETIRLIKRDSAPAWYLEAPNRITPLEYNNGKKSIFLAGSITGAVNWQNIAKEKLLPYFNVINPRRENFDVLNPLDEELQITWEYNHLNGAAMLLFWFSDETLAPITLFELGSFGTRKPVFIGINPNYKRKSDVEIQMKLRGVTNICYDLDTLIDNVIKSK